MSGEAFGKSDRCTNAQIELSFVKPERFAAKAAIQEIELFRLGGVLC